MPLSSLAALGCIILLAAVAFLQWGAIRRAQRRVADTARRLHDAENENSRLRELMEDLARSRETILDAMKPRRVSATQGQLLVDRLSLAARPPAFELRVAADPEAESFAAQLQSALEAAGATVLLHRVFGVGPNSLKGGDSLRILRSDLSSVISEALSAAGLGLRTIDWPEPVVPTDQFPEVDTMPDAMIMISRRATVDTEPR